MDPQIARVLHDAFALGALAGFFLGWLFASLTGLHFAEEAFALHLFLQRAQGLLDIVIADDDLYYGTSPSALVRTRAPA